MSYVIKRTVPLAPDAAEARVRETLADEGFGVLTEIDVRETLKKKLDVDFRPYRILGACNPTYAHQALTLEEDLGALLPCNVIVYEGEQPGTSVIAGIDPIVQLGTTGRADLRPSAVAVRERMERAIEAV